MSAGLPSQTGSVRTGVVRHALRRAWPWGLAWVGLLAAWLTVHDTHSSLLGLGMSAIPLSPGVAAELLALDAAIAAAGGIASGLLAGIWPRLAVVGVATLLFASGVAGASFGGFCMDPGEACVPAPETDSLALMGGSIGILMALAIDGVMSRWRRRGAGHI